MGKVKAEMMRLGMFQTALPKWEEKYTHPALHEIIKLNNDIISVIASPQYRDPKWRLAAGTEKGARFVIHIDELRIEDTDERGKKLGTIVMAAICEVADRHGVWLTLLCSPEYATMPQRAYAFKRLSRFYKRNGFVFTDGAFMVREPKKAAK